MCQFMAVFLSTFVHVRNLKLRTIVVHLLCISAWLDASDGSSLGRERRDCEVFSKRPAMPCGC